MFNNEQKYITLRSIISPSIDRHTNWRLDQLLLSKKSNNCWNAANRMPVIDYETHKRKRLSDAQTMWNIQSIDDWSLVSCETQEAHQWFFCFALSYTRACANFCVCPNCNVTNTIDSNLRKWIFFFFLLLLLRTTLFFNIFYDFNGRYIYKPVETCVDV